MRMLLWLLPLVLVRLTEGLVARGSDHLRRRLRRLTFEQQVVCSTILRTRGHCIWTRCLAAPTAAAAVAIIGADKTCCCLTDHSCWCSGAFRNNSGAAAAAQGNRQRGYWRRTPVPAHVSPHRPPAYNPEVASVGESTVPAGSTGRAANIMDEAPVRRMSPLCLWPIQQLEI